MQSPIASSTLFTQAGRALSKGLSKILPHEPAQNFNIALHNTVIPNLPEAFQSFRVVQLSDIHFYEFGCPQYYQKIVDAVQALKPDMIITTGDTIHYGQHYLGLAHSFLKQLQAPFGKWSCMGNHDYSDDFGGLAVKAMMEDAGFIMLINEAVRLEKSGAKLWLSGIDDCLQGSPQPEAAYYEVEEGVPHLSLLHNPRYAPWLTLAKKAPHLIFSGHTHGGQIKHMLMDWLHRHVFHMPYQYGWFQFEQSKLYVTSGVGSASVSIHLPHFDFALYPFRINTSPEIAVFDLMPATARAPMWHAPLEFAYTP